MVFQFQPYSNVGNFPLNAVGKKTYSTNGFKNGLFLQL